MPMAGNMISETKTRVVVRAFIANLIPLLCLLIIGYPLARTTIRTMLLGWVLMVVAIMQLMLQHLFQTIASAVTVRTASLRSADRGRYGH
jgi:predicted ABC-type exoprotein transport system permease subunit